MEIREIDFENLDELKDGASVIWGAGHNGEMLYRQLAKKGIAIDFFYDDDRSRWGESYCGRKILSRDELESLDRKSSHILISSMYIGQIAEKASRAGFQNIYAALDMLLEKDTGDFGFKRHQDDKAYFAALEELIRSSEDGLTRKYYEAIRETVRSGRASRIISDLYCGEKQYLIKELRGKLDGRAILDGGAYTGDTVRAFLEEGVRPQRFYCFEADPANYEKLEKYAEGERGCEAVCENVALWDKPEKLAMKFSSYNARIDLAGSEGVVDGIRIDDYFRDKNLGYVKMDIEGAEQRALAGGMEVIRRDRPILAISIYHSLEDMVEIPRMLQRELEGYRFLVRHHSYTYSESVLYALPIEQGF